MNASPELIRFAGQTHACAMQMMENAAYIQTELPGLEMPDSLRDQIAKLCNDLVGSKHDLISEAIELEDAMAEGANSESLTTYVQRIQRWIAGDIASIHECVGAINEEVQTGTVSPIVAMLIMESAANIFNSTPPWPATGDPDAEEAVETETRDEDEEGDTDCYGFYGEDIYPISQLIDAIGDVMDRPELTVEVVEQLRVFRFALERLPLVTPGVRMSVGLRLDQGGESDWIEIRIEDDVFTLGRGAWIDGDADTETVFEVGPDYREGDAFQASSFAQSFLNCAEDVCREVVIEDSSDEPFDGWNLEQDQSRWSSIPCSFL